MIVGFTGTRHTLVSEQRLALQKLLEKLEVTELHHGDCVGADAVAHTVAKNLLIPVVLHPPLDPKMRSFCSGAIRVMPLRNFIKRNQVIVDTCELLVACVVGAEIVRSGTWSTVRYARRRSKPVAIIWRDGTVTKERV